MPTDSLTAAANTGTGTDKIAGKQSPGALGFIGASFLTDKTGVDIDTANPLPVNPAQIGATNDTAATSDGGTFSLIALTKRLLGKIAPLGVAAPSASAPVTLPNDVTVGAAASIAAVNIDLLTGTANGWYDAANFHSVAIQVIGAAGITAGAVIFEQTNDIAAALVGNVWPVDEITILTPTPNVAAITIAASTTRMFGGAVTARYVRVRVSTAFAGGNVQAVAVFSQLPYARSIQTVHQATAANLNATVSGTVTANVSGTGISGGTISPLTVAGAIIEASSAKTASGNSASAITNASGNGAIFFVVCSAASGTTPTLVVKVQVQDPVSLAWFDMPGASTGTFTGTGSAMFAVMPGLNEVANSKVNYGMPRTYRLAWTITGTTPSFTFGVGVNYII